MKKGKVFAIASVIGAVAGVGYLKEKKVSQKQAKVDKFKGYYNMLNEWLALKQGGKSLDEYFKQNNYKTVAIYGMGEMGNRLYDELKTTDIEIKYAIDKNVDTVYAELEVKEIDDELPDVDVVVVTATFAFDDIVESIQDKFICPIVSLENVVFEV